MKEIKRIFLFIKRAESNEKIIKKVRAISEDEKHKFEFELCQADYVESVGKLKAEFEKFCVCECGFDNSAYCDVWSLDDEPLEWLDDENYICLWLGSVDWCCYQSVEFDYKNKNAHIQNPLLFDEFKESHGYDESKEPLETKRIYDIYKREIDKTEFTEQEVENMAKFLSAKRYSALFEAIDRNYPMRFKLRETLCNLYIANKAEYEKQVKGLSDELMRRITVMLGHFAEIFSELPTIYHERCDYDAWVAYESDEGNRDIPIYLHKHFDIIPEGIMKYIIYAITAEKYIKDNQTHIAKRKYPTMWYDLYSDEVGQRVRNMAFNTGSDFGIYHYKDKELYDKIISQYPDRKENLKEIYDEFYRQGVYSKIAFIAEAIVSNTNEGHITKESGKRDYPKFVENNPDFRNEIIYTFYKNIYRHALWRIEEDGLRY